MAVKPTIKPVSNYQLVGYTLRCWPQSHFYSTNLVEILSEYNVPTYEAKKNLKILRRQGFAEYLHRPPGLWRVRKAAKNFPVSESHAQIYAALVVATESNIDARLADTKAPDSTRPPTFRGVKYRHIASAALQIWPHNHFEIRHLAGYCDRFAGHVDHPAARSSRTLKEHLVDDGRLWISGIITRLGRITPRGRFGPLGHQGPELLAAMRNHPPEAPPPWHDYVLAYALDHPGEWPVARLMRWAASKPGAPTRPQVLDCLKRLESARLVERMQAGRRGLPTIWRTRPALYEAAALDLTLYEQLLHPEGRQLVERCYPEGRPEELHQLGQAAPELADDATVATQSLPADEGMDASRAPSSAQVVTLQGLPLADAPEPVAQLAAGPSSSVDMVAGMVDYINELRAGAGVTKVERLRTKVDNLTSALQAANNETSGHKRAINQLNAIKARQEEQIKNLSGQLAAANNRLETAKRGNRPKVRTVLDKGSGFGLGEVATFKGRPLSLGRPAPVVEKKRARG